MTGPHKALIVTTMKNEGPYILEWVAHHLALGFDGFLVFTNDCDDLTDRILDRLSLVVNVKHQPNPKALFADKGNWQVMAQRYARLFNIYRDADWIYHTDVDEFLFIKPGQGRLPDLFAAAGAFDVISFTSMAFSSDNVQRLEDRFVTRQFTRYNRHYAKMRGDTGGATNAIKTMFRNAIDFDLRRNHRPLKKNFSRSGAVWIDGSGQVLGSEFVDGKAKSTNPLISTALAQFNHYAIKSAESFLIKVDRGDVSGTTRLDKSRTYWEAYNTPGDAAPQFSTPSTAMLEAHTALLADPVLAQMHAEAFAMHQAKVRRILSTASGQEKARWLGLLPAETS